MIEKKGNVDSVLIKKHELPIWLILVSISGIITDCISTFLAYKKLAEQVPAMYTQKLPKELGEYSDMIDMNALEKASQTGTKALAITLLVFIIWDIIAYIRLLAFQKWSYKFVLSIAFCGILSFIATQFFSSSFGIDTNDGSPIFFQIFNIITIILLIKNRNIFN